MKGIEGGEEEWERKGRDRGWIEYDRQGKSGRGGKRRERVGEREGRREETGRR